MVFFVMIKHDLNEKFSKQICIDEIAIEIIVCNFAVIWSQGNELINGGIYCLITKCYHADHADIDTLS